MHPRVILFFLSGLLMTLNLSAQNIGINETGANPHNSAILDVSSTNKGMLVPRLTTAQRTGIGGPANGLLVYDSSTASFWFYDGSVWVELVSGTVDGNTLDEAYNQGGPGAGRVITANAGTVSIQGNAGFEVTGNFGSGPNIGNPGAGTRMFFNPRKAAFRAGRAFGNEWNQGNVGNYSSAFGREHIASGEGSFAAGWSNQATADYSVSLGTNNSSTAVGSVTIGDSNLANNTGSFASGQNSLATGIGSIALGESCNASGEYAIAMGNQSSASGNSAVAMGKTALANGQNSTAFGNGTIANGFSSSAFGSAVAGAQYSFALGRYNEGGGSSSSWVPTEPLFEIGNGVSPSNKNNAVTVLKNGNTGIGTHTPSATLHIDGSVRIENGTQAAGRVLTSDANGNATWTAPPASGGTLDEAYDFGGAGAGRVITADAGVVSVQGTDGIEVTGTFGSGAGIGNPGAGTRMFFSPRKAAFRAGYVSGNQWNGANVGNYSVAFGNSTTASGLGSFAAGQGSNASGDNSVALGNSAVSGNYSIAGGSTNVVSGDFSAVFGQDNNVTGDNAVAMGYTNFVSGEAAVAMGETTTATGYAAVSIGNFTTASGYSSSAFGNSTTASGYASTAFGYLTTAESYLSVAYGRFNVGGGNGNSWQPQDAIFEIGIGTSVLNKDNAVTVLKNGNTGIGTASPTSTLHVDGAVRIEDGTEAEGRVLVTDDDGNAAWSESVGFSCIRTNSVALVQGNALVFNFALHNRGNAYNPTTGEFTAPVEGLYQFHYIEHNNAAANANTGITVRKNGVFYKQLHTIQVVSSTRYANTITWAIELDAGDVVTIELLGNSRTISGSAGGAAIKSSLEGFLVR